MSSTGGASKVSHGILSIKHSSAAQETINLDSLDEVESLLVSLVAELLLESESTSMDVLCELLHKQQWSLAGTAGHTDEPDNTESEQSTQGKVTTAADDLSTMCPDAKKLG